MATNTPTPEWASKDDPRCIGDTYLDLKDLYHDGFCFGLVSLNADR